MNFLKTFKKAQTHRCISDLELVFHDVDDLGFKRSKDTPSASILAANLIQFKKKRSIIAADNGIAILNKNGKKEIENSLKHVSKGCLSNIKPSSGTNKNDALH